MRVQNELILFLSRFQEKQTIQSETAANFPLSYFYCSPQHVQTNKLNTVCRVCC